LSRKCHVYCRFCFRRNFDQGNEPTKDELDTAISYLLQANLEEVILSGGDPLMVSNLLLLSVIDRLSSKIPVIRIHTRAIITAPFRVNAQLVEGLSTRDNIWVIVHCNHPNELSPDVEEAIKKLTNAGVPLLNQTVLLKGVNDQPEVLAELSRRLVRLRVFPYYLHHTDHAQGASDFIVSLARGMEIYNKLSRLVSGIALPRYVIDPPSGSGKMDVGTYIQRKG
jgi:lysine 2,3-aminomutase